MQPPVNQFRHRQHKIRWQGRAWTMAEANALAVREQSLGNFQAAADLFKWMLSVAPSSAELHNNRGVALQQMRRYREALTAYDRAVSLKPDYPNAHFNRGSVLRKLNRSEEALAAYARAIELKADHAEAHNNRGVLLQEMKRHDEALASYDQAVQCGHAAAHNNRGTLLMNRGNLAEAEAMFRKALELKPEFADPLFNLANVRRHQDGNEALVKEIRVLLQKPGISDDDGEQLHFALGKIYDDGGCYDDAFNHYEQANRHRNTRVTYNRGGVTHLTDSIIHVFDADLLGRPLAFTSESCSPIFIVGMPRSGTTLLAGILSSHRAIASAGELSAMDDLASDLVAANEMPYPQAVRQMTPEAAIRLADGYERRLWRHVGDEKPYVIDKNPLNFRHLGLIARLFPRACILHCTRHPLDTVLSNYFQRFPLTLDYSFDLHNTGHFYREYARLMEHWRRLSLLNWMEISYEEMILNTEPTVRRVLDFLGLDWNERCLAPHTNPHVVETASQWQVRQPIYRHALERWRFYEKHLAPLRAVLE